MDGFRSELALSARGAAGVLALGAGAGALVVAQAPGSTTTYAGRSAGAAALMVGAGLSLAVGGCVVALARRSAATADLALAAGLVWSAPAWIAWQDGPAIVRSSAMVVNGFAFPLILHLVLAQPAGRLGSTPVRFFVGLAYLESAFTALTTALFRDPYLDRGCWANCTVNSFLLRAKPSFVRTVATFDRWFVVSAAALLVMTCLAGLARASRPALARQLPVAGPAILFAAAVAARELRLGSIPIEDPFDRGLFATFIVGCAAIVLLAAGLVWSVLRTQAERRAVAQIVASLDEAPSPGFLQSALADALHDSSLRIAYRLPDAQRYVDADGRTAAIPTSSADRAVTRLIRNGREIAAISHSSAVTDLDGQLGPAVRLGLDNERLRAETLAQVEELRISRTRIVETADRERRALERDLHDGAQQRLLALSYDIRLARASAEQDGDIPTTLTLSRAIEQTQLALDELRELARGIYPAILTDAGLIPALSGLVDTSPLLIDITGGDDRRYPSAVETAAYFAVAEVVDDAARRGADRAELTMAHDGGRLILTFRDDGCCRKSSMLPLADRVGALGGDVVVEPTRCRVEIPCA